MMFEYVKHLDAVGTLYHEACVRWVEALNEGQPDKVARFDAALKGIKAAWPELVDQSIKKDNPK